jgi:hypothetical protein
MVDLVHLMAQDCDDGLVALKYGLFDSHKELVEILAVEIIPSDELGRLVGVCTEVLGICIIR